MNYLRRRRILTMGCTRRTLSRGDVPSAHSEVWREIPIFGARSQDLPPAFD